VKVAALAYASDGRLIRANAPARQLVGGDCAIGSQPEMWMTALRARTASGIPMPREDLPPVRALAGEALGGVDVLVRVREDDVLVEVLATPARDPRGHARGAIVLLHDVTEQRRHEAALRARRPEPGQRPLAPLRSGRAASEPRGQDQSTCGGPSDAESNGA